MGKKKLELGVFIPASNPNKLVLSLSRVLLDPKVKQVVLFDNGNASITWHRGIRDLLDIARQEGVEVIIYRNKWNGQYGSNYKKALELVYTEYVLVLEEDIIIRPKVIEKMLACLDECDFVTSTILNPNNLPNYLDYTEEELNYLFISDWAPDTIYKRYSFDKCVKTGFIATAVYAFKRKNLPVILDFKPEMDVGVDVLFSKYLLGQNMKTCLRTGSLVYHLTPKKRSAEHYRRIISEVLVNE